MGLKLEFIFNVFGCLNSESGDLLNYVEGLGAALTFFVCLPFVWIFNRQIIFETIGLIVVKFCMYTRTVM